MSEHEHKFNATVVDSHGRCSCGAWGRWSRISKTWTAITNAAFAKGLDTRLRRMQDPDFEYPKYPPLTDKKPDTDPYQEGRVRNLVAIYGDPSKERY